MIVLQATYREPAAGEKIWDDCFQIYFCKGIEHGNSPPQADFFKDFGMAKYNFVKGIYHFGSPKTQKFRLRRAYGTANQLKNPLWERFFGSLSLWERKTAPKLLMGKILAGHPPPPGGGVISLYQKFLFFFFKIFLNFFQIVKILFWN